MSRLKLAVATRSLGTPLRVSLVAASRLGAAGVQLDVRRELPPGELSETGRREFLHMLKELGLEVGSMSFPARNGLLAREQLNPRIDALKQAMTFAYDLGCRVITARLGPLPPTEDRKEWDLVRGALADVARHGNRVGAIVAVAPGQEPIAELLALLDSIVEGPLGVDFDPASLIAMRQPPLDVLREAYRSVHHVAVRDVTRGFDGLGSEVPVGRGDVPWDEIVPMLQEGGYRGWFTAERTQGDDRAADLGRALQYASAVAAS